MKYTKQDLENLIFEENLSYEAIGRLYGVSGAAVKKAAKNFGLELPSRRKVNQSERFGHSGKSKVDSFSDEEFCKIIANNIGWKNIDLALGYAGTAPSNVHERIKKRCSKLGIEPVISKPSPILQKTKGELLSDRKNYQSYRSGVRKLAEVIYSNSGKPLKCAICGYDKHVEIAHVRSVSGFDNDTTIAEINSINNLIALCPNHHWEYDNGILKL